MARDEAEAQTAASVGFSSEVLAIAFLDHAGTLRHVAISAPSVRHVARGGQLTRYPGSPADIIGVTAIRGQIVVVLALTPRDPVVAPFAEDLVLLESNGRALALVGATPIRVTASENATEDRASGADPVRLWTGRVLPVAGAVRLLDASGLTTPDGAVLPLLDVAALLDDVIDDPDGGR